MTQPRLFNSRKLYLDAGKLAAKFGDSFAVRRVIKIRHCHLSLDLLFLGVECLYLLFTGSYFGSQCAGILPALSPGGSLFIG